MAAETQKEGHPCGCPSFLKCQINLDIYSSEDPAFWRLALLRRTSVLGLWPKTLAQAKFISAEHVKSPLVSIKITTPNGVVIFMEQVKGIEPSYSAWEADVLPLNYTCNSID